MQPHTLSNKIRRLRRHVRKNQKHVEKRAKKDVWIKVDRQARDRLQRLGA